MVASQNSELDQRTTLRDALYDPLPHPGDDCHDASLGKHTYQHERGLFQVQVCAPGHRRPREVLPHELRSLSSLRFRPGRPRMQVLQEWDRGLR